MGVGKSVIRVDSYEKVTGQAKFTDDIFMEGMLYAKVFRSNVAHGVIKKLNIDKAKSLKGVKGVFTYKDIPGKNVIHVILEDQPFLAEEKVMYKGEPIAVVAAETPEIAEEALSLIECEIEELPAILDFEKAMNSDIKLYGDNNVISSFKVRLGEPEKFFNEDYVIVEGTFRTKHQEHAYLEPQGAIAYFENDTMTVRGSMQCPFYVQRAVAETLGMPMSRVRIIQQTTGGAFGGKEDVPSLVAAQAAICAYHTKRPVKLVYDREEDMKTMSKRHPSVVKIKLSADKNGRFKAIEGYYLENAGAYSTLTPAVLWRGTVHLAGPYKFENAKIDSFAVCTNTVPNGAYRGFGSPQVIFAMETIVDMMAEKLGMDPVDLRKTNLLKRGEKTVTGQIVEDSMGMTEVFEKAVKESNYYERKKEFEKFNAENEYFKKGIGVSTLYYGAGLGAAGKFLSRSAASVQIFGDGSVSISVGVTEMGQGLRTVTTQVAAEFLGIDESLITISQIDTSRVPDTGPTVASRGTMTAGWGVLKALEKIKKNIKKFLENYYNEKFEDVHFRDSKVYFGDKVMDYKDLIALVHEHKVSIHETGFFIPPHVSFDEETGQGDAYYVYAWAMNVVETEVNVKTGEVKLLKATCVHDVGKAINPREVKGQIMGGSLQGLGYGLMENMILKDGEIITDNFSTYTIPTACDYPEWKPLFVESNYSKGPYGAKGFAEQPLMGMAPALTNSIHFATGIFLDSIPAIPEKIIEKLGDKNVD